ncbi:MAG: methionine adenosyltransferase [Mogibacterium sp.]|jgi:S-adenosylmethionine synthetase|nr:methionine adenosyltransferase [Mogibacterium sp.]
MKKLFTSESVTEGHPDKLCDQVSDAVLDAILAQDPNAHVACECAAKTGFLMIFGEASGNFDVDYEAIARKVICDIGYDSEDACFDGNTCRIIVHMEEQSADIAMGVNKSYEAKKGLENDELAHIGAGDQGMMFGYANSETEELMPMSVKLAHVLALRLTEVRKNGTLPYLRPDGKTQVTVEYDDGKITRIDTIVVSTQHSEDVTLEQLRQDIHTHVIAPVVPAELIDEKTKYYINPTGRFVIGGPMGDSGLTGRKIIVDTYGGHSSHGGGAFSGKDPTKVDRSGAYMARYIAKNIVAAGIATECEVQLAYAIGVAEPVSVCVDTFGTGKLDEEQIANMIMDHFDMRPAAIIRKLELNKPQYRALAAYGQMGRTALGVKWEETDKADELRRAAGSY